MQDEVALADWNGGSGRQPETMTREAEHVMWEWEAPWGWAGMAGTVRKESTQTAPATSPHKSKKQRKMNAYACAVQACSNSALLSGLG